MNASQTKLEAVLSELFNREKEYEQACINAAEAESEYRIKIAREFRLAEGTVDAKKNAAIEACAKELSYRDTTDAIKDFTREKVKNAQIACSLRQSIYSAENRSDFGHSRRNDVP